MFSKRILAAITFCLMITMAALPSVIGQGPDIPLSDPIPVERLKGGGPKISTVNYEITIENLGWMWVVANTSADYKMGGLKVEIYDITDGSMILIFTERCRFDKSTLSLESTHIFVSAGYTYVVALTPSGGGPGKMSHAQIWYSEYMPGPPPVAIINAPSSGYVDEEIMIDGSESYDPDGMIVQWLWDFGDGTTGTGEVVTHYYIAPGTYWIYLEVMDDRGNSGATSKMIDISYPLPVSAIYTISNMFEYCPKSADYNDLGRHKCPPPVGWYDQSWWPVREWNYGEVMLRDSYPFVVAWPVYSVNTAPASSATDAGFALSSFYRLHVDKYGLNEIGTGPEKDPIFVPILDATYWGGPSIEERMTWDGGTIQFSYFGTYLTSQEICDIKRVGNHYANWYYGVTPRGFPVMADDGYWWEQQGIIAFDVAAAQKYLGLAGVDLAAEFTAANSAVDPAHGDVSYEWNIDWYFEGGPDGPYDIYTAYDYSLDIRYTGLTLDPSSTSDTLVLRLYSVSWGGEMLLMRYLEAANVVPYWQTYNEDFTIDGTISSDSGDISIDCMVGYHLIASKDPSYDFPCWSLERTHVDFCGNVNFHMTYLSPYNPYDPDVHPEVTKLSTLPGTVNFGNPVNYWYTPMEMDLRAGETMIIQLPTGTVGGYTPTAGTGIIYDANSLWVSGTLELGTGDVELGSYDSATRTLTFAGPMDFPSHTNPLFPSLLESGSPTLNFIVI